MFTGKPLNPLLVLAYSKFNLQKGFGALEKIDPTVVGFP